MMDRVGNSTLWKKLHDPASVSPRVTKWPHQQNQFPSKYEQLPGIGMESPRPRTENQIVPMRRDRKGSPRSANMDVDTEERMRQLEVRLGVSEKSNRALLEEVLRLQSDLRTTAKRSEDVLREERDSRQQLSEAIRISNELISQLSARIKETEDKIEDEKSSLNALFSHTKNVEKTVVQSQHDLQQRRDAQTLKIQELRAELGETQASRNQLEQLTYTLSEELRTLRQRVEQQQAEFSTMIGDVRSRARKLEEENRMHLRRMDSMRKQSDLHNMSDITQTQLRGQVEQRLSELRDVLMDLRGKHETEQNERRNLEKAMQAKITELNSIISEQQRKREEGMHSVDMVLREKEHAAQAERLQMNAKVVDTVEEVNKRLMAKEQKIKEEIQGKFIQLEKLVQREQHSRQEYEKGTRDEQDRKWQALKKFLEEELTTLRDSISTERGKNRETITKLDQSISIVERQLAENKKQVDKILTAEIKSRKQHETAYADKINSINEKLQIATSTLQQAVGGVAQNMSSNNEKLRRELKEMMTEQSQGSTRALSDMDAKVTAMKQRVANMEDMLDAKVANASQALTDRLTDRMEAISKWQDTTGDTLRELGRSVQTMPQDIYQLEEKLKLAKSEMDSRVSHESDARSREVEELRSELQNLKARLDKQPKPATLPDLEAMNIGVRKLADNLQTVKTVLGMKIQSEQKLRISGLDDLQSQINQLKILTGTSLTFPARRSQMDDLDTGLGWDDLGTLGTNTGTPSTSIQDKSRQQMSDPHTKATQPAIKEEDREDSPFETKGGLKNMNIPSPTPKGQGNLGGSPRFDDHNKNTNQRHSPGNVTPDNWKTTPRGNTPDDALSPTGVNNKNGSRSPGKKTPIGGKSSPSKPTNGKKSPGARSAGRASQRGTTPNNDRNTADSGLNEV